MNTTKTKGDILADTVESFLQPGNDTSVGRLKLALAEYRAPWTLGRSVNGHTLADGQEWHREDFTPEIIKDRRPLLNGEAIQAGDFGGMRSLTLLDSTHWISGKTVGPSGDLKNSAEFYTTTRPILSIAKPILTPDQIAAGWIEWRGGDCPVWGGSKPRIQLRNGRLMEGYTAEFWRWNAVNSQEDIIAYLPDPYEALKKAHAEGKVIQRFNGTWVDWVPDWTLPATAYRVKPEPVMVELCADDIKPGDVIRHKAQEEWFFRYVQPKTHGIVFVDDSTFVSFDRLRENFRISSDGGKTWVKCEKEGK